MLLEPERQPQRSSETTWCDTAAKAEMEHRGAAPLPIRSETPTCDTAASRSGTRDAARQIKHKRYFEHPPDNVKNNCKGMIAIEGVTANWNTNLEKISEQFLGSVS